MNPATRLLSLLLLAGASIASALATSEDCGWPAAATFCDGPEAHFEEGVGYPQGGSAGPSIATTSTKACCCACAATAGCNGFTVNGHDKTCYLKTDAGPATAVKSSGCISAIMPPPPPYKPKYPTPQGAKNVLFLAVDDMRPSLGAYNFTLPGQPSHSPNIDRLAGGGLLFKRAYVQYAYCSPSRNSFMSGRRPDTTKVWEFEDHFREAGVGADWVSMPEFFKQFGYLVLGGGKLYHPASATENIGMANNDYPASWSPEYPYFLPTVTPFTCASQGPKPAPPGSRPLPGYAWCAVETPKESALLFDQQVRDNCLDHLELASNATKSGGHSSRNNSSRPFFVGCGFHKPHAPHFAPREFFDAMPQDLNDIPLPLDPFAPEGMPEVAWHPYADVSGMQESPTFNGTVNMTRLRVYRRSYYASIAFQDYNIGVILDKLEALGHKDDTVVVVFGDHGKCVRSRQVVLNPTLVH